MPMGRLPTQPLVMAMLAAGCGMAIGAPASLQAQLHADRAHAEALGLKKGSLFAGMTCADRKNVYACLGTLVDGTSSWKECAWAEGKCTAVQSAGPDCCKENMCAGSPEDNAKCKKVRFRFTCTQWAKANGADACGDGEVVSSWDDDDPAQYGSYRTWKGYNCKDGTCDTREQCCYVPKIAQEFPLTCANYKASACEYGGRLLKNRLEAIECTGKDFLPGPHKGEKGSYCKLSDCCDNTCAKSKYGRWYCPAKAGTLFPDDDLKTIRCSTVSEYGEIACSDDQCCESGTDSKYIADSNKLEGEGVDWKLPGAIAIGGVATLVIAIVARRVRGTDTGCVGPDEDLLEASEGAE